MARESEPAVNPDRGSGDLEATVRALAQEVRELKDREAIRDVLARYNRSIDRMDRELLLSTYHPDAVDDHGAFCGSPEEFADFAFPGLAAHFEATFFSTGTTLIELNGDSARCESYVFAPKVLKERTEQDAGQVWLGGARFLDRLERRDGEWRIARRRLIEEWGFIAAMQTNSIGPYPYPPDLTKIEKGRRDRSDLSYEF